jgi:hypothetical protein
LLNHGGETQTANGRDYQRKNFTSPAKSAGGHRTADRRTFTKWLVTIPTFEEYLLMLKMGFPEDEPVYLILDCYSVHLSQAIREYARRLGIVMKFIPAGMTDSLQTLDRAILGMLTGIARRLFRIEATDSISPQLTTQQAAQFLDRAWSIFEPFDQ